MSLPEPAGGQPDDRRLTYIRERELAQKAFYTDYSSEVYHSVYQVTRDPHLADEATNEAFARLFIRWETIRADKRRAWVHKTALNYARSWRRSWSRWRARQRRYDERHAPAAVDRDEHAMLMEVLAALRRLPRRQREVMVLRYQIGFESAQIAEILGIDANTVRVHEHRALKTLREVLGGQEETR